MQKVTILFICFISTIVSCQPSEQNDTSSNILKELQGGWTSYEKTTDYSKCDVSMVPALGANVLNEPQLRNWYIKDDSIWEFEYPCEYLRAYKFEVHKDSLYLDKEKYASVFFQRSNNAFSIVKRSIGSTSTPTETEHFLRDTLDLKIIELLKKDTVNLECLTKRLKIITKIKPEEGTAYERVFPVKIPTYIDITDTGIARLIYNKREIKILIEKEERLFYVTYIEWNDFEKNSYTFNNGWKHKPVITVRPAEWWKGEMFEVQYQEE